jgi:multiple antibiotic resistance protein
VDPLGLATVAIAIAVPIFVAMDPIGALPLVLAWTAGLDPAERDRQLRDALVTALALGLIFVIGGRWLLGVLGVSVPDFLVAGGLVLLVLAISDLVVGGSHEGRGSSGRPDFGAVPIGTPILAGPATLATLLVLVDRYGWLATGLALLVILLIAWRLFGRAAQLTRLFGRNGLRPASRRRPRGQSVAAAAPGAVSRRGSGGVEPGARRGRGSPACTRQRPGRCAPNRCAVRT